MTSPSPEPAVRIALQPSTGRGPIDGAWWPRSRDLVTELPTLVGVLDPLWGRITRVAVNPLLWPLLPSEVRARDRALKIGWLTPGLDPYNLLLLSQGTRRYDLLVISPGSGEATAGRLMAAACTPDGPYRTASALIATETTRHHDDTAGDRSQSAAKSWEHESRATPARPAALSAGR
ncbi:DUF5994 family protein [Streptomyces sp. NPDC006552]|uniref:DUF5994 family protein n=1 Tax=Streptomyces sp. NPDC006552 TaxID=3157179 RepID=UPI0033B31E58